jgi:hypothetical protein
MADFASGDEVLGRAQHIFMRSSGFERIELQDVRLVDSETPQGTLHCSGQAALSCLTRAVE